MLIATGLITIVTKHNKFPPLNSGENKIVISPLSKYFWSQNLSV